MTSQPSARSCLSLRSVQRAMWPCRHQRPASPIHHASYQPPKRPRSRCGSQAEMLAPRKDPLDVTTGTEGTRKHPGLGCEGEDRGVWVGWKISAFRFTPCLSYLLQSAPLEVTLKAKAMKNSLFHYFFSTIQATKYPEFIKLKQSQLQTHINTHSPLPRLLKTFLN